MSAMMPGLKVGWIENLGSEDINCGIICISLYSGCQSVRLSLISNEEVL